LGKKEVMDHRRKKRGRGLRSVSTEGVSTIS